MEKRALQASGGGAKKAKKLGRDVAGEALARQVLPWESGTVDLNAGVIDPCLHKPSHGVPSVYYTPIGMHFKIPHGIWMKEATSVAVDSRDFVFVFNRGNVPVLVFDREGNMVHHWGNSTPYEGTEEYTDPYGNTASRWRGSEFRRPHAVNIDHEDNVWLTDDMANTITKCDRNGKRLMLLVPSVDAEVVGPDVVSAPEDITARLGKGALGSPKLSGRMFNRPTDVCVHPASGDIFVTDGYGNARVHRLTAEGRHIMSWGKPGTDAGCFNLPHSICVHPDGDKVMVADRENSRVQIFTLDGEFVEAWPAHRAVAVYAKNGLVYIAEQGTSSGVQKGAADGGSDDLSTWTPNIGHRVQVFDPKGKRVDVFGGERPGENPSQFCYLHSLAVDSHGDVYAAEVSFVEVGRLQRPAREMSSLRKWAHNDPK